jgi:hypothetical protein
MSTNMRRGTIVPTLRYGDVAAAIAWLCNAVGFGWAILLVLAIFDEGTSNEQKFRLVLLARRALAPFGHVDGHSIGAVEARTELILYNFCRSVGDRRVPKSHAEGASQRLTKGRNAQDVYGGD